MKLLTKSEKIENSLNTIGIKSSEELINYLPYRYDDFSYIDEEKILDYKKIVILGRLVSNPKYVRIRNLEIITFAFISVNDKFYKVKIFNRGFYMKTLNLQDQFTIIGTYDKDKKEINVINMLKGKIPPEESLKGVYTLPDNLSAQIFRNLVKKTLSELEHYTPDILPSEINKKYHFIKHIEALKKVHFPNSRDDLTDGLRVIKYEECLEFCMKNYIIRENNIHLSNSSKMPIDHSKVNHFVKLLPFKLSKDQLLAIKEIVLDMEKPKLMYRLLQGDVGTGKTIVAFASLYANFIRGNTGAFMVPMEALAKQHYQNAIKIFEPLGVKIGLLIGSLTIQEKNKIKESLINGEIDILIGTHALFSKDTFYPNLGLSIIDEQHRFGVNQRNLLAEKGSNCDLLLMSATPIPRTLSLSIFGDLDVSTLTQFPFGQRKVKTDVLSYNDKRIDEVINETLTQNRRIFIVCPKILFNDNLFAAVESVYELYNNKYPNKVISLHSKLKEVEKEKILDQFKSGEKPILVSTTVIELGIDIKDAGLMIVYEASNFGLASLHQLRGRVGRDGKEAKCLLLMSNSLGDKEKQRLDFLKEHFDGFEIAEEDMKLRGPGDFLGIEQSGFSSFNHLNIISDFKMFEYARNDAKNIYLNQNISENYQYVLKIKNLMIKSEKEFTLLD